MYAISPTCKGQQISEDDIPLTENQKSCICPFASNDTWLLQCIKPELCTDQEVNKALPLYKAFAASACANAVAPTKTTDKPSQSATGTPPTSTNAASRLDSSSKVAIGAVVAVFAALL
ncbi:MAG: hypothetical protein J3R72DRAFT_426626 [Linnemannia gamsii]|nr:MAG: hypothetical protein J3R72DRAFT_426626 [Linnemannia gamsii]